MLIDLVDNDEELNYLDNALERLRSMKLIADKGFTFPAQTVGSLDEECFYTMDKFLEEMLVAAGFTIGYNTATKERGELYQYEIFFDEDEMTIIEMTFNHPDVDEHLAWMKEQNFDEKHPSLRAFFSAVGEMGEADMDYNGDYNHVEIFVPDDYSCLMMLATWFDWVKSDHIQAALYLVHYCKTMNEQRRAEADGDGERING